MHLLVVKQLSRACTPRLTNTPLLSTAIRLSATQPAVTKDGREILEIPNEPPERDLVNFPRLKRPVYPAKVRMGFLPDSWFQFFYHKTGVTGPYFFGAGLLTYMYSKEILLMDHEFWTGVTLAIMISYGVKKMGPGVNAYVDKEVDTMEEDLEHCRSGNMDALKEAIKNEEHSQWQAEGEKMLFEAKRENVHLQLEAEFRKRQMTVYNEVKKRLDFQFEVQNVKRRLQQKHMVNWIVDNVVKSISPQQEKDALQKCITDLKSLAAVA
ncbi:ATP synthase subunit b, mitochondrial-like [Ornithodoros turicata]